MGVIINLFSVFDPSSSFGRGLNWVVVALGVLLIPSKKYISRSRRVGLIDLIINKLYGEVKVLFSKKGKSLSIVFYALFLFIIFNNTIGLLPYIFTPTSHLAVTLRVALPLWFGYFVYGWVEDTKGMLAHLIPQGTPGVLIPFMVVIERVSSTIRPGTLAVRLIANIIAGHLLLTLISGAIRVYRRFLLFRVIFLQILLVALEVAVAIIQSYVLVILSVLYSREV